MADESKPTQAGPDRDPKETIKGVCERAINEPAAIWETLESKGIDATPGAVYQAISELTHSEPKGAGDNPLKIWEGDVPGLTAEDVKVVAELAARVGGLDRLISILTVMQHLKR